MIAAGGAVIVGSALIAYVVLPFTARWTAREESIAVKAEQRGRMAALVGRRSELDSAVAAMRGDGGARAARMLVGGETEAIAASALVTLLNGFARESGITLQRVDLTSSADTAVAGLIPIPLEVTGNGPLRGLVDLLFYLRYGDKLIVIDDFFVNAATGTTADEVNWGATLHAYYASASGPE